MHRVTVVLLGPQDDKESLVPREHKGALACLEKKETVENLYAHIVPMEMIALCCRDCLDLLDLLEHTEDVDQE